LSIVGGFLDGMKIEFTDGLNCLIGHRGTGKTTVLEFVRYALDEFPNGDAGQLCRRRVEALVKTNLADGRIRLAIQTKDGLDYIVDRTASGEPLVLTADGQPTDITISSGGIFSADIFSQNEVENIADSPESQLVLIDTFVADQIGAVQSAIADVRAQLDANAKAIIPAQESLSKLADELSTLPSVAAKIEALANVGGDNADEINRAQTHKALRQREQQAMDEVAGLLREYIKWLGEGKGQFGAGAEKFFTRDILEGPNGAIIARVRDRLRKAGVELDRLFQQGADLLLAEETQLGTDNQELQSVHQGQELQFRDLITKHKAAQGQATERAEWEKKRNDLLLKQRQHAELEEKLKALRQQRRQLADRLTELRDQRFRLRHEVAERITQTVNSSPIRVRIEQDGNRDPYVGLVADALRHAGLQHNNVAARIGKVLSPAELVDVVRRGDEEVLKKQVGLNDNQASKVISSLRDPSVLLQMETVELVDMPRIELEVGDGWKDSLSLSTGQKCTTILPILLMESENPLLVDQPEDNLDNRFIYDTVVDSIRRVKPRRQIILITHNPNIPVLGDANGVFVLTSDGNRASLLNSGGVDQCRDEIVNLLEGGEEAFVKRKERYKY
jgi:DNA repair ATPase RecN